MIRRRLLRSGEIARVVIDDRGRTVLSAVSRLRADGPADIDWATNAEIDSISAHIAGEIQEVLGELRENVWMLNRLGRER